MNRTETPLVADLRRARDAALHPTARGVIDQMIGLARKAQAEALAASAPQPEVLPSDPPLAPCPRCGSQAEWQRLGFVGQEICRIKCTNLTCHTRTAWRDDRIPYAKSNAVADWNRRAAEAQKAKAPATPLAPCPECGRQPLLQSFPCAWSEPKWEVQCCLRSLTIHRATKSEAVADWNRRAAEAQKAKVADPPLAPCPECGRQPIYRLAYTAVAMWHVVCPHCCLDMERRQFSKERAAADWNQQAAQANKDLPPCSVCGAKAKTELLSGGEWRSGCPQHVGFLGPTPAAAREAWRKYRRRNP